MTFIEPEKLVRGWKRIRLSPYKPKTQLMIREKYLAMKCGLLGKYVWGAATGDRRLTEREIPSIRRLLKYRLRHNNYAWAKATAKKVRESQSVIEIIRELPRSRYGYANMLMGLFTLADAELDIEGKTDEQIEAFMLLESI